MGGDHLPTPTRSCRTVPARQDRPVRNMSPGGAGQAAGRLGGWAGWAGGMCRGHLGVNAPGASGPRSWASRRARALLNGGGLPLAARCATWRHRGATPRTVRIPHHATWARPRTSGGAMFLKQQVAYVEGLLTGRRRLSLSDRLREVSEQVRNAEADSRAVCVWKPWAPVLTSMSKAGRKYLREDRRDGQQGRRTGRCPDRARH